MLSTIRSSYEGGNEQEAPQLVAQTLVEAGHSLQVTRGSCLSIGQQQGIWQRCHRQLRTGQLVILIWKGLLLWQLLARQVKKAGRPSRPLLLQDCQGCPEANLLDERLNLLSFGELCQP